jgi:hypothetical protein
MLSTPFDRRLVYLSGKAPAFMSMVQPLPIDKEGLKLVSDKGGVPLHLDLYSQHRRETIKTQDQKNSPVKKCHLLDNNRAIKYVRRKI